jgi:riboflavin kinase/FMN adenylyltransferase
MEILQIQRSAAALPPDTAVCMGAFDGLHLGHRALIQRADERAQHVALVTFDPHPMQVLAPERAPRLLHSPTLRERAAASLGVDHLVLLPFDREMSKLSPEEFVERYLVSGLAPSVVVVGRDFRFGAQRAGDIVLLEKLLGAAGIDLAIVDPVLDPFEGVEHGKLSSTDIRNEIDEGHVDRAARLLGRFHSVHGRVAHGAKRGRTIGFPTANVDPAVGYLPPLGVYATFTTVWSEDSPDYGQCWASVTNVGRNPTFTSGQAPVVVESHVLGQDLGERLYGVEVDVAFVERLRGEVKFDGPDALVAQIRRDASTAQERLDKAISAGVLDAEPAWVLRPPKPAPASAATS